MEFWKTKTSFFNQTLLQPTSDKNTLKQNRSHKSDHLIC